MKRLVLIVLILGIGSYIAVQYLKDRRFNPPSNYDYPISAEIDTDFYKPEVLQEYYKLAFDVGTYARSLWFNEGIDVLMMDKESYESTQATDYYNRLRANVKMIENDLIRSQRLRTQGYTKDQVKMIMEMGLSPEDIELQKHSNLLGLSIGQSGADVWQLQKLLNASGDSIPEDGIFNIVTRQRLRDFQRQYNLYPSGEVDEPTLKALLK